MALRAIASTGTVRSTGSSSIFKEGSGLMGQPSPPWPRGQVGLAAGAVLGWPLMPQALDLDGTGKSQALAAAEAGRDVPDEGVLEARVLIAAEV
jgi:hypothetical protein